MRPKHFTRQPEAVLASEAQSPVIFLFMSGGNLSLLENVATRPPYVGDQFRYNSHRFFLFGRLEGGRLFRAHAIKHARENRNVGLVLDQRTEMIGVK